MLPAANFKVTITFVKRASRLDMNERQAKVKCLTCFLRRSYAHTHYHISRKIRKFGNMLLDKKLLDKKGWTWSAEKVVPNVYNWPGFFTLNRKKRQMVNVTKGTTAVKERKHQKDTESLIPGQLPYQCTHQDKVSRKCLSKKMARNLW